MSRRLTVTMLMVCLAATGLVRAQDSRGGSKSVQGLLAEWKAGEGEVDFYGKVVDQFGQPVAGAAVTVDAPVQTGYMQQEARKVQVVTDAAGCFHVSRETYGLPELKSSFLFIRGIAREGYEYIAGYNANTLLHFRRDDVNRPAADPAKPAVYHVRKILLDPRFLLRNASSRLSCPVDQGESPVGFDLIRQMHIQDVNRTTFNDEPLHCDLQAKFGYDAQSTSLTVTLSSGTPDGGILASSEMLYEAPASGYLPEVRLMVNQAGSRIPSEKFLYLRSRTPAVYSRLEITGAVAADKAYRISFRSVTNPYGERNLEEVKNLPSALDVNLDRIAKDALVHGSLPAKPDLPALIREAKEQAAAAGAGRGK